MSARVLPWTAADERRYHAAMAQLCEERGFVNLAQSHLLASLDCPAGCKCSGCEGTRARPGVGRRIVRALREAVGVSVR